MTLTVYVLRGMTGKALYVGCTNNLTSRLSQHRSRKRWFNEAWDVDTVEYATLEEASRAEAQTIADLDPEYNLRVVGGHPDLAKVIVANLRARRERAHDKGRECHESKCVVCHPGLRVRRAS